MTLTPSKILELLAAICFLAVAVGQAHVGVVSPEALLRHDLERFEIGVENLLAHPAEQEELDALVGLAFNIGLGALEDSTLLDHVNAGRHADAVAEFGKWVHGNDGKPVPGLVKRREKEAHMYRRGGRAG
jgi:lysozyme